MKRLTLLSGGEKSMTALAFLFAVFLARPCPFYILDEVEAALDDLNIDRFLALLRTYSAAGAVHRRHPPEADDGGRRLALRRLDGRRRDLEGDLAAAGAGGGGRIAALLTSRAPMARDWHDLFILDEGRAASPSRRRRPRAPTSQGRGVSGGCGRACARPARRSPPRSRRRCSRTSTTRRWERLEEALIYADVGARTTAQVVGQLEREATQGEITGGEALTDRLVELLADIARTGDDRIDLRPEPTVILVAGVNGTGKTTTVGKLAWHLRQQLGQRVVLGAGGHLPRRRRRAARAVGAARRGRVRAGSPRTPTRARSPTTRSPRRRRDGADVVIVDTAGRLHTQDDLMAELAKIRRVIAKQIPEAPHETLLTVDATTGQNGLRQARLFSEAIGVDGLVLTKLDGTAKGGIALAIASELGIPVKLIGVGEQLEDLRPFEPLEFARALVS